MILIRILLIIILLLSLLSLSFSLSSLKLSSSLILQCSKYLLTFESHNDISQSFNSISQCLDNINYYVNDNNWELIVLEGLQPLSLYLKKASISDDILLDNFKSNLLLASIKVSDACEITGCIVQASAAGDDLIESGMYIKKAGESLQDSDYNYISQQLIEAGIGFSTFGTELSSGKFK